MIMKDREFLQWIHARLECVHGENINVDYMHKLRAIIHNTDKDIDTPNISSANNSIATANWGLDSLNKE